MTPCKTLLYQDEKYVRPVCRIYSPKRLKELLIQAEKHAVIPSLVCKKYWMKPSQDVSPLKILQPSEIIILERIK